MTNPMSFENTPLHTLRRHSTPNFTVEAVALPETNPAQVWDDEVMAEVEAGRLKHFCLAVRVYHHGEQVAASYLSDMLAVNYDDVLGYDFIPKLVTEAIYDTRRYHLPHATA